MVKTVWILGAGFSRPLGGPLLNEMFTPVSMDRVRTTFPEAEFPLLHAPSDPILRVYAENGPTAAAGTKRRWENAEDYLEFLDATVYQAKSKGMDAPLLKSWVRLFGDSHFKRVGIPTTAQLARRLMAAECSHFYVEADTSFERWQPYRRWVGMLRQGDAVVTFNYDTVVEESKKALNVVADGLKVILPAESAPPDCIPLIKLHGSIDWRRSGSQVMRMAEFPFFALNDARDELVIASPGPTKQDVIRQLLEPLWALAVGHIEAADAVVFVGYRFPPSDSLARERLMKALGANRKLLHVHTVLGPDVRSTHSQRLVGMVDRVLDASRRLEGKPPEARPSVRMAHRVTPHAMGAEDFLALYDAEQLRFT